MPGYLGLYRLSCQKKKKRKKNWELRFKTLHYYAGGPLKDLRTDTLGNVGDTSFTYYAFQEFFVRFYALSVRHRAASHLPIAIRSSLVVREINKIEPPQSRTPSLFFIIDMITDRIERHQVL